MWIKRIYFITVKSYRVSRQISNVFKYLFFLTRIHHSWMLTYSTKYFSYIATIAIRRLRTSKRVYRRIQRYQQRQLLVSRMSFSSATDIYTYARPLIPLVGAIQIEQHGIRIEEMAVIRNHMSVWLAGMRLKIAQIKRNVKSVPGHNSHKIVSVLFNS